jgi:hypothetical protein
MPADQASIAYAMTHGLAPMLYGAAKGTVATIPGVVGDVNELLRDYAVPYLPTGVQQALAKAPAPYTTEQYVNMMPKMGGHTEDVATKLGSNIVGAVVDPFAVVGALKRAPAAGRALAETATNKILQGESLIPGMPAQFINPPVLSAVKGKGGNWLNNRDVEVGVLEKLKKDATGRPIEEATTYGYTPQTNPQTDSVNRWVDKKLGTYIRNEMGTPTDPVRLAHQKGYSHIPGNPEGEYGAWLPEDVAAARVKAGFPEEGFAVKEHADAGYPAENELNTRKAEMWENISDTEINRKNAGEFQSDFAAARLDPNSVRRIRGDKATQALKIAERNPWLEKVSPDTPVYHLNDPNGAGSSLGFDHLIDELHNAVDPASGLPQQLRWKPEDLDKVTMQQAVERVSKINDWRADQAAKAEREGMMSNLTAAPRLEVPEAKLSFVDKPGMKWVDIPETTEKNGLELCTTIGRQGGWCTQGKGLAENYGSGQNRLTALLDAEGRPHAQAKITQQSPEMHKADFLGSLSQEQYDRVLNNNGPVATQMYEDWAKRNPPKPNITELKPVGNEFSSARAQEYEKRDPRYQQVVQQGVLDFLNKGDWGKVRDLDHYDIFDLADPKSLNRGLEDVLGDYHLSHERASIFNAAVSETPDANRFMNRSQLQQFVSPYSIEPNAKPEGYKDGGGVSAVESGDPSMQFYSRTMENPDKSKMTETGIAKQFEEDYMRFAVQRYEQPKRQDIPNPPAPATRTNLYGEYGTPMMGGMVSGRVTKLNDQPDTYMGDLAYRTNIGPGMAHLGVQGMRTPQMPAQVTGYNAGYNLPLGGNGFAGVNVMQPAQGGKPVLGAQVQYRKSFAKGGAVRSLETNLPALPKIDYHSIDELMTHISKEHKIAPQKLHDDFVAKHRMTPDTWIKRK